MDNLKLQFKYDNKEYVADWDSKKHMHRIASIKLDGKIKNFKIVEYDLSKIANRIIGIIDIFGLIELNDTFVVESVVAEELKSVYEERGILFL